MTINASDILAVTKSATKKWTKQRKAEERGKSRSSRAYVYSNRVNFTDVEDRILPEAYAHTSDNGRYTVDKRQMYYAAREPFREATGREITADYFTSTLLRKFLNRNRRYKAMWKITASPRGTVSIPNTGEDLRIPCGTIAVGEHLENERRTIDGLDFNPEIRIQWPSVAAGVRYQAVLYIEKEGFDPQLREADIANRYAIVVVSCKGQSVEAARRFVDEVFGAAGIPILIAHDFDKSGFEIAKCLTSVSDAARRNDTVLYEFKNDIEAIDIGLRLTDIEQYGLLSESCDFRGELTDDLICTPEEKDFLRSGRRVELNAFTAPQLIEWLECKLTENGITELFIPSDDVLADAYRRAMAIAELNHKIEAARDTAIENAKAAEIPKTLRRQLRKQMKESPEAWDAALYALIKSKLYPDNES